MPRNHSNQLTDSILPVRNYLRSGTLGVATLLANVLMALGSLTASAQDSLPNIVVFLVDDMGIMDTSVPFLTDATGAPERFPLNDFYRTPSMQRLAERGIRFNQFYAMSVCSPTRISIMTGQNAARHHATNWINPDTNNPWQNKLPIPAGAIQPQMASVCDLLPTITKLTGAPLPAEYPLDGAALDKLLSGGPDPSHPPTFLMHYPHSPHRTDYFTVFRHGDWKVIYHYYPSEASENSHYQLYNLADDPFESTNQAQQQPEQLKRMVLELIEALDKSHAQYPVSEDGTQELRPEVP